MNQINRPTLEELDADGALLEAASRVDGHTRAIFLRRAAAVVGGGAAVSLIGPSGVAFAAGGGDTDILNYALTLEYLEAAFYREAVDKGALNGQAKDFARVVAGHEEAHVQALKKALGSKAVKKPKFTFKGTTASQSTFLQTSLVLENTGVGAYLGQAGNIKTPAVLKAALSILPIEARHASWVADIIGAGSSPSPAPQAFEAPKDMATVLAAVQGTGFISGMSGASAGSGLSANPSMTG